MPKHRAKAYSKNIVQLYNHSALVTLLLPKAIAAAPHNTTWTIDSNFCIPIFRCKKET